jgi:hypothetical protein
VNGIEDGFIPDEEEAAVFLATVSMDGEDA